MARLSRKERFAGLREQMATNKEESLTTNDLDKFADRLKQLNEVFGDDVQKLLKREERPEEKFSGFKIPSFEETKDNLKVVDDETHDFLKELDIDKLNKNIDELIGRKEERPIEVIEEPIEPKPEPIVETKNEEVVDEISKIIEEQPIQEEPIKEETELVEVQPALNEEGYNDVTKIIDFDELNNEFNKSTESYENDINNLINELLQDKKEEQVEEPIKEDENPNQEVEVIQDNTPIVVLPVKEAEKPVIEIKKTIINPIKEDAVVASLVQIIGPVALYVKKEKPVYVPKVDPIKEEVHDSQNGLDISKLNKIIDELINHKEVKPIEEIPVDTEDEVDGTTTIVNGNYLDEALKEANDYNHQEGNKTLDELKEQFYKKEEPKEKIDEEFSNTVNLEIDKVLSEVQKDVKEAKVEEKKEDLNKTAVFEHPVLAKEATDGLEILPMEETLKLDVIDDTIPFTALDNEEDDDEEDSGFGKIINVILIILIVVLLAIIGIIGYFLLAANGVI